MLLSRSNAVFYLPAVDVVVRLSHATPVHEARAARVVWLARWIADHGGPALAPTSHSQPVREAGMVATLWPYLPSPIIPRAHDLATAVRELHHLGDQPPQLSQHQPLARLHEALDLDTARHQPVLSPDTREWFFAHTARLQHAYDTTATPLGRGLIHADVEALCDVLKNCDEGELVGISCLVQGSDQIFARVVLEHGGAVEVVLPAADYRERKIEPDNLAEFDDLMSCAHVVRTLPCAKSDRDAYLAASEEMLDSVGSLIAIWDGNPSGGYSGTADVVAAARERGIPVTVVWPDGARRD